MLGLKRFGLSHSLNLIETLCTDASFSQGKQVSVPILLRGTEPGAGLLGNVNCTFRGLETLKGHEGWFGRSWEGLLGRPWPKRPWQGLKGSIGRSWPGGKVERYSHFCPPDHGLVRSSCMLILSVRGWLVKFSAGS